MGLVVFQRVAFNKAKITFSVQPESQKFLPGSNPSLCLPTALESHLSSSLGLQSWAAQCCMCSLFLYNPGFDLSPYCPLMITGLLLGPVAVTALPAKLRHQVRALPNLLQKHRTTKQTRLEKTFQILKSSL